MDKVKLHIVGIVLGAFTSLLPKNPAKFITYFRLKLANDPNKLSRTFYAACLNRGNLLNTSFSLGNIERLRPDIEKFDMPHRKHLVFLFEL